MSPAYPMPNAVTANIQFLRSGISRKSEYGEDQQPSSRQSADRLRGLHSESQLRNAMCNSATTNVEFLEAVYSRKEAERQRKISAGQLNDSHANIQFLEEDISKDGAYGPQRSYSESQPPISKPPTQYLQNSSANVGFLTRQAAVSQQSSSNVGFLRGSALYTQYTLPPIATNSPFSNVEFFHGNISDSQYSSGSTQFPHSNQLKPNTYLPAGHSQTSEPNRLGSPRLPRYHVCRQHFSANLSFLAGDTAQRTGDVKQRMADILAGDVAETNVIDDCSGDRSALKLPVDNKPGHSASPPPKGSSKNLSKERTSALTQYPPIQPGISNLQYLAGDLKGAPDVPLDNQDEHLGPGKDRHNMKASNSPSADRARLRERELELEYRERERALELEHREHTRELGHRGLAHEVKRRERERELKFKRESEIRKARNAQIQASRSNTEFLRKDIRQREIGLDGIGTSGKPFDNKSFVYPLVENDVGCIRLIRIESCESNHSEEEVRCTLVCAKPWQSQSGYECLSYCWGDASQTEKISLRTCIGPEMSAYYPFNVTTNLRNALRRLRDTHASRWLWIDAICIDQRNLHERAAQVGFMKEIYKRAEGVVIWLGESSPLTTSAVSAITVISRWFASETSVQPDHIIGADGLRLTAQHLDVLKGFRSKDRLGIPTQEAYEQVATFFSLPWFRRVWVLQEAFSGSTITARIGTHSLPWGSVILATLWQSFLTRNYTSSQGESSSTHSADAENDIVPHSHPMNSRLNGPHISRGYLPELWLGLLHTRIPRGLSMLELVCRARDFQATDPRDKVFALLGLANDIGNAEDRPISLLPDYTKTKERVYCDFAKSLIIRQRNLGILSAVDTFTAQRHFARRFSPSWMPDLDVPIATIRGFGYPRKYRASALTAVVPDSNTEFLCLDDSDAEVLGLSGFVFDSIKTANQAVLNFRKDLHLYWGNQRDAVRTIWHHCVNGFSSFPTPSSNSLLTAYINTLTATGFASPFKFPDYPLGEIIPSDQVPNITADFAAYWAQTDPSFTAFHEQQRSALLQLSKTGDADQFAVVAGKACNERLFFFTRDGHMGLCPRAARVGDLIVILYGGSVPYVLRRHSDNCYTFVGECYVHGMMFGEALEKKERYGIKEQVFRLR